MIPVATINSTQYIVQQFAAAVQEKDYELLWSLLADEDGFETQDSRHEVVTGNNKQTYITWLKEVLADTEITKIEYDNCILCKMGNPVVIFNDGQFPKVVKDSSRGYMNTLMLDIADGKIVEIKFCNFLASHENKYQYEINAAEMRRLMNSTGISHKDAIDIVLKKNGY